MLECLFGYCIYIGVFLVWRHRIRKRTTVEHVLAPYEWGDCTEQGEELVGKQNPGRQTWRMHRLPQRNVGTSSVPERWRPPRLPLERPSPRPWTRR